MTPERRPSRRRGVVAVGPEPGAGHVCASCRVTRLAVRPFVAQVTIPGLEAAAFGWFDLAAFVPFVVARNGDDIGCCCHRPLPFGVIGGPIVALDNGGDPSIRRSQGLEPGRGVRDTEQRPLTRCTTDAV